MNNEKIIEKIKEIINTNYGQFDEEFKYNKIRKLLLYKHKMNCSFCNTEYKDYKTKRVRNGITEYYCNFCGKFNIK